MADKILYHSKRFTVTNAFLKTSLANRTYALRDVDYADLKRRALPVMAGLCGLFMAYALVFYAELYPGERLSIIGICALLILISSRIGTLTLHSHSFGMGNIPAITWEYRELKAVQRVVDQVLYEREKARAARAEKTGEGDV